MIVVLLAACSSPNDEVRPSGVVDTGSGPVQTGETGDPCTVPSAAVGTGVTEWNDLADGDPLTVVFGPQGGWHVDVAVNVVGTGQVATIEPRLVRSSDGLALTGAFPAQLLALLPAEPCGWTFYGLQAVFDDAKLTDDPASFVCGLDGAEAVLSVTVRDDDKGVEVDDRVTVTLQKDPDQVCP